MTPTGTAYCAKCRKDTEHSVDLVAETAWCLTCHPEQASKAVEEPPKPRNHPEGNRHHAIKVWSETCHRMFDSKAEARRGDELALMEKAEEITNLQFQVTYVLSEKPKVSITLDFKYKEMTGLRQYIIEDVKGWKYTKKRHLSRPIIERDFKVKLAWLKEKYGIEVKLVK